MILAFVLMPLLQKDLSTFKDTIWNTYRIRQQKDTELPNGVPNHIYAFQEEYGFADCGKYNTIRSSFYLTDTISTKITFLVD